MIFVTVGTTIPFNGLIEAVDTAVADGTITEKVICQIGASSYEPRHCEFFRFRPSIDDLVAEADLILGHGGTGTYFQLLGSGKPFIVFANPLAADDHQAEFLGRIAPMCDVVWSADPTQLPALLERARQTTPKPFEAPRLHEDLLAYLNRK